MSYLEPPLAGSHKQCVLGLHSPAPASERSVQGIHMGASPLWAPGKTNAYQRDFPLFTGLQEAAHYEE